MRMLSCVALVLAVGACAETKQDTRPDYNERQTVDHNATTVTAEQNDAIDALFRRKAPSLHRCWQDEYERTQNRKLEGDITLQMVVSKKGQATGVKVVKSTLGVPAVDECVVNEVSGWQFPEGPGDAPYRRTVHLGAAF